MPCRDIRVFSRKTGPNIVFQHGQAAALYAIRKIRPGRDHARCPHLPQHEGKDRYHLAVTDMHGASIQADRAPAAGRNTMRSREATPLRRFASSLRRFLPLLLVIGCAGAYGAVMGSNYNSKPLAAEVLVEAGQAHLIRRRQTWDDLVAAEV